MKSIFDQISIVTDEASLNVEEAFDICLPLNIKKFELRNFVEGRVPFLKNDTIDTLKSFLKNEKIKYTVLSPGFFKDYLFNTKKTSLEIDNLPYCFQLMDILNIPTLSIFSFKRKNLFESNIPNSIYDLINQVIIECNKNGKELVIENSPSCYGNSGFNLKKIINQTNVKVIWDPANAAASNENAYPEGYNYIKDSIKNIHIKNWDTKKGYVNIKNGIIDYNEHLINLFNNNFTGNYCIEHHQWENKKESTILNYNQLSYIIKKYYDAK